MALRAISTHVAIIMASSIRILASAHALLTSYMPQQVATLALLLGPPLLVYVLCRILVWIYRAINTGMNYVRFVLGTLGAAIAFVKWLMVE